MNGEGVIAVDGIISAAQGKLSRGNRHFSSRMKAVICAVDGESAAVDGIGVLTFDTLLAGGILFRLGGGSGLGVRSGGLVRPAAPLAAAKLVTAGHLYAGTALSSR